MTPYSIEDRDGEIVVGNDGFRDTQIPLSPQTDYQTNLHMNWARDWGSLYVMDNLNGIVEWRWDIIRR